MMLDIIVPIIAGILIVMLFIRAIDKRLKAMVTLVDEAIKYITNSIDDSFIDFHGDQEDLDAQACNRKCQDRRPPSKHQRDQLIEIGLEALKRNSPPVAERKNFCNKCSLYDTCTIRKEGTTWCTDFDEEDPVTADSTRELTVKEFITKVTSN